MEKWHDMEVVLISGSPRRKELLNQIGIKTTVVTPDPLVENISDLEMVNISDQVKEIAVRKLASVSIPKNQIGISADTVVVLDGVVLGKPKNQSDARRMLTQLSGKDHEVYTGFALNYFGKVVSGVEKTKVSFRKLTVEEIEWYIQSNESSDKAGGYGIQGKGAVLISKVEGCYFNVVGLPLHRIWNTLIQLKGE